MAEKLFVSGVHRGVDVAELLRVSRQSPGKLDCCIFLGYEANDTLRQCSGNRSMDASEQGFSSLRLVTASYHMPRSLQELKHAMPELDVVPHPVFPERVKMDRMVSVARNHGVGGWGISEGVNHAVALGRAWNWSA